MVRSSCQSAEKNKHCRDACAPKKSSLRRITDRSAFPHHLWEVYPGVTAASRCRSPLSPSSCYPVPDWIVPDRGGSVDCVILRAHCCELAIKWLLWASQCRLLPPFQLFFIKMANLKVFSSGSSGWNRCDYILKKEANIWHFPSRFNKTSAVLSAQL